MGTNKKIIITISSLLFLLALAATITVSYNFFDFGLKSAIKRAKSIAESVRDGLTSHMINDTMSNRFIFLDNMMRHQDVVDLRILRSKKVIKQYGKGNVDIYEYDDIEKEVLKSGNTISKSYTLQNEKVLRVSIPYIATKYSAPNCLHCHTNAKEGDVLGVVSMDIRINNVYSEVYSMVLRIALLVLVFLILSIFVANRLMKPYMKLFDDLKEGITKAYKGDFSFQVNTNLSNEAGEVARKLNELSEIFKFKRTIELDPNKDKIYARLAHVLENSFNINDFIIFEIDSVVKKRVIAYKTNSNFEKGVEESNAMFCRSYRTTSVTFSTDFQGICDVCCGNCNFVCIPYPISDRNSLVLYIQTPTVGFLEDIKEDLAIIKNYFELAKPVLETKMLLDLLHKNTIVDPLSGLHNRRYLDNLIDTLEHDNKITFTILMIDIDHFKSINDTYGHDVGDIVIKEVANVLKSKIKGSDVAIRYGGEEFLVFLFNANLRATIKIAEDIRADFAKKRFNGNNKKFSNTLSIGISKYPNGEGSVIWQCIKQADTALYKAKKSGRDKVVVYDSNLEELELELNLRKK